MAEQRWHGQCIVVARKKACLSRTELARRMGILPQHLWRFETGARYCSEHNMIDVANALEITMKELMTQESPPSTMPDGPSAPPNEG